MVVGLRANPSLLLLSTPPYPIFMDGNNYGVAPRNPVFNINSKDKSPYVGKVRDLSDLSPS